MRRHLWLGLTIVVAAAACKVVREAPPTGSDTSDLEARNAAASMIPDEPSPSPLPTPRIQAPLPVEPGPGGAGDGGAPSGSCGEPLPSGLSRLNVKVFATQSARVVLDATPLVGPDAAYCQLIGYTDGRSFCPVRPPGHPERTACEALVVGSAVDTGRTGPTWSADGRPCEGPAGEPSCQNHPSNQFLVFAYGAGTFRACAAGGTCGQITLP